MAIAAAAPFAGRMVPLMNEHFATAADLRRLLGELDEAHDQHAAADNGPKTAAASARRLARMLGADLADAGMTDWRELAAYLAEAQLRRIDDACRLVLSRRPLPPDAPLVGAGCGRHLVPNLARRLGRPWRDLGSLWAGLPPDAVTCAPAMAVALLAPEPDAAVTPSSPGPAATA